jgi:hypothetical protein
MWKNLLNKMKFNKTKKQTPGNVYIPNELEVNERKEDVDNNEK